MKATVTPVRSLESADHVWSLSKLIDAAPVQEPPTHKKPDLATIDGRKYEIFIQNCIYNRVKWMNTSNS
jgi:hypothetical protein